MAYTTPDIITWTTLSQPLALYGEDKRQHTTGGTIDPDLHMKIYVERKSLEWQYAQDPTDADGILYGQGNYVYALCFPYILESMQISGSGGAVAPVTPFNPSSTILSPIIIKGELFTSALSWGGANYVGINVLSTYTLQVFYNTASIFLTEGIDWERTSTGFDIILGGSISNFDATGINSSDIFYVYISV